MVEHTQAENNPTAFECFLTHPIRSMHSWNGLYDQICKKEDGPQKAWIKDIKPARKTNSLGVNEIILNRRA